MNYAEFVQYELAWYRNAIQADAEHHGFSVFGWSKAQGVQETAETDMWDWTEAHEVADAMNMAHDGNFYYVGFADTAGVRVRPSVREASEIVRFVNRNVTTFVGDYFHWLSSDEWIACYLAWGV